MSHPCAAASLGMSQWFTEAAALATGYRTTAATRITMRPPHSAALRRVHLHPEGRRVRTAIVEVTRHGDLPAVLVDPRDENGGVLAGLWLLGVRDTALGTNSYSRVTAPAP